MLGCAGFRHFIIILFNKLLGTHLAACYSVKILIILSLLLLLLLTFVFNIVILFIINTDDIHFAINLTYRNIKFAFDKNITELSN